MKTRHAVDAFRIQVDGSKPHSHLMAVGTVTCDEDGTPTPGAVTLRNLSEDGTVCDFYGKIIVVRRSLCPVCHEPIICITPDETERMLPEGKFGNEAGSPC